MPVWSLDGPHRVGAEAHHQLNAMRFAVILIDGKVKGPAMPYNQAVVEYKQIDSGGSWKELAILETAYRHKLAVPVVYDKKPSKK